MTELFNILLSSFVYTLEVTFGLFGGVFIFGLLLYLLARFTRNLFAQSFGYRAETYITAWVGTPVHELGHAFFCLLFGHKIKKIILFSPNSRDGSLGSVSHSYNPKNIYHRIGNFFIGIGPLIFGSFVILLLIYFLLPSGESVVADLNVDTAGLKGDISRFPEFLSNVWVQTTTLVSLIFSNSNFGHWQFWVFMYLSLAISSHMELSPPDLKQMWSGLLIIVLLTFVFNLIYVAFFSQYNNPLMKGVWIFSYLDQLMMFGLVFSLINFLLTWLISSIYGIIFLKKIPNPFTR